jgi:hypothetical protein
MNSTEPQDRPPQFDQAAWISQARALLDDSAQEYDAATLSRLNRARQAALVQRQPRKALWLLPTGLASACALLLAMAMWHPHVGPAANATPGVNVAAQEGVDSVALSGDEAQDFYQNLDFYAWLDAQDDDNGG